MTFRNTPLFEVLEMLTKRFHVEFIVEDSILHGNSFTGIFNKRHLPLILEHLRLISGMQYRFVELERNTQQTIQRKVKIGLY